MVSTTSGAGSPSWSCAASQYLSVNAEPSCHALRTTSARSAGYEWGTRPPVSDRVHARRCRLGGRAARCGGGLAPPLPAPNLRHVVAVLADVQLVLDELIPDRLLRVRRPRAELRQAIDHVGHRVDPIELVPHRHVERCRGRPFLLVAGSHFTEAEVSTSTREHRGVR